MRSWKKVKTIYLILVGSLFLAGSFFGFTGKVFAQIFSLSPSTVTKKVGEEFTVDVNIDTQGKAVAGADVKMTFDATILEVKEITKGDFFSEESDFTGSGSLYVAGFFKEQFATKTGSGKLATLTLAGKKEGTSSLSFVCSAQTNDSNILDAAATDIIQCSETKNGTYLIAAAGGGEPTDTPTPTATSTPAQEPTPTSYYGQPTATPPQSGFSLPTSLSLGTGMLLTILGLALIF